MSFSRKVLEDCSERLATEVMTISGPVSRRIRKIKIEMFLSGVMLGAGSVMIGFLFVLPDTVVSLYATVLMFISVFLLWGSELWKWINK